VCVRSELLSVANISIGFGKGATGGTCIKDFSSGAGAKSDGEGKAETLSLYVGCEGG
jgi:hypothetical protein